MDHQSRVNGILAKLRKIASDIPGYRAPVTATEMRALVRNSTVPREFVEETAVAVEATPRLHDASGFDYDDARDGEAWADAYDIVANEMEIIARGIRYAVALRRANIGRNALRTLALAKALNRQGVIVPHVEVMQKALAPKRRRG